MDAIGGIKSVPGHWWFRGGNRPLEIGSYHDGDEARWDTDGWPYFVGYRGDEKNGLGGDFHVACGIQDLAAAEIIRTSLAAAVTPHG